MFSECNDVDLMCRCLEWEREGRPYRETVVLNKGVRRKKVAGQACGYRASLHAEKH